MLLQNVMDLALENQNSKNILSQHQDFTISLEKIPDIFFKLLDLDPGFLQMPVENWHESGAFIKNLTKIQGINVINDGAERYIKLSSDFIGSAQNEESTKTFFRLQNNLHLKNEANCN